MMRKPLVTISVPVLNEEGNITILYKRLKELEKRMEPLCELEFLFTDNKSNDKTWQLITEISKIDYKVKGIRFSKNFGFQRSILANYLNAQGDAVMQIDADLQDPPELLEQFFEKWQNGYHVVYGIRKKRPENPILYVFRKLGYWAIDKISEYPIPRDVGDFRLIDKKVVTALGQIKNSNPYLRGMIAGLGFNQIGIPYDRDARSAGDSKFNVNRLIRLGLTAVFNHSTVPLRVASFLGMLILAASIIGAIYYAALKFVYPDIPQGLASIHILVLFGIGLNSFFLGILGEYLLRIYTILRNEPVAIIEQTLNIETNLIT